MPPLTEKSSSRSIHFKNIFDPHGNRSHHNCGKDTNNGHGKALLFQIPSSTQYRQSSHEPSAEAKYEAINNPKQRSCSSQFGNAIGIPTQSGDRLSQRNSCTKKNPTCCNTKIDLEPVMFET